MEKISKKNTRPLNEKQEKALEMYMAGARYAEIAKALDTNYHAIIEMFRGKSMKYRIQENQSDAIKLLNDRAEAIINHSIDLALNGKNQAVLLKLLDKLLANKNVVQQTVTVEGIDGLISSYEKSKNIVDANYSVSNDYEEEEEEEEGSAPHIPTSTQTALLDAVIPDKEDEVKYDD